MGGQACIFYGAAQVSKDVDLALLSEPANIHIHENLAPRNPIGFSLTPVWLVRGK